MKTFLSVTAYIKRMTVLITGCAGFIGSYLCGMFEKPDVHGTFWNGDSTYAPHNLEYVKAHGIKLVNCDFRNPSDVKRLLDAQPDTIFHLAAQSLVTVSFDDPLTTMETNINGTFFLLEAVRKSGLNPRIVMACSSSQYGHVNESDIPINESTKSRPTSPYGVSKLCQDALSYQYFKTYGLDIVRARMFNITGPRKMYDVCSDFTRGVVEFEKKKIESIRVGNLDPVRDFTDVRDCIRALKLLGEKGKAGEDYNLCSGSGHSVQDFLDMAVAASSARPVIVPDEGKIRKNDDPIFIGDNSKIGKLGWKPSIMIEKTIDDMVQYWRSVF